MRYESFIRRDLSNLLYEESRPRLALSINLAQVLPDHPETKNLHAAQKVHGQQRRRPARTLPSERTAAAGRRRPERDPTDLDRLPVVLGVGRAVGPGPGAARVDPRQGLGPDRPAAVVQGPGRGVEGGRVGAGRLWNADSSSGGSSSSNCRYRVTKALSTSSFLSCQRIRRFRMKEAATKQSTRDEEAKDPPHYL